MESLHFCLQLLCLLGITGFIIACGEHQLSISGFCCNECEPGFYVEIYCSDKHQTICKQCAPGFFSENSNFFDRCEECRSCDQEYSQKCTSTSDAKCSCSAGFLCSDDSCSKCEEAKTTAGTDLTKYTFEGEPLCQHYEYYNKKDKACQPRLPCSAHGLVEIFAGNKTHNAICQPHEMQHMYMVVIIGFVLLIVIMIVIFSYHSVKKIKKIKACKTVTVTTTEVCPLSMEETVGPVETKDDSFG